MSYAVPDRILEKYRNKKLEEIFEKDTIIEVLENDLGEFLRIRNGFGIIEQKDHIKSNELAYFSELMRYNLGIIAGIGEKTKNNLHKKMLNRIDDLVGLSKDRAKDVKHVLTSISCKDVQNLKGMKNVAEEDLLFCVNPEEILFLDIETTGQAQAQIFLIGIGFFMPKQEDRHDNNQDEREREKTVQNPPLDISKYDFITDLLFAREISEEAAILKYFVDLLPNYRMFVSYNGKHFDIPFICDRVGTLLENSDIQHIYDTIIGKSISLPSNEPIIQEFVTPFEKIKKICSTYIHFDLYFAIKRTYRDVMRNFRLKTAEEQILEFFRVDHLASEFIPQIYLEWLEASGEKMGALYKVMEHNFYDVQNLARLLKEWIRCKIDESKSIVGYNLQRKFGLESIVVSKKGLQKSSRNEKDHPIEAHSIHHTRTTTLDEFFK